MLKWLGLFALAAPVLLAIALYFTDWNHARGYVAGFASRKLGRDVQLSFLHVRWGRGTTIHVKDLEIANPPWSGTKPLLHVEDLRVTIDLLKLLTGRLSFPEIVLDAPELALIRDRNGNRSWATSAKGTDGSETRFPQINRLSIKSGSLAWRDELTHTDVLLKVSDNEDGERLDFSGQGKFQGQNAKLKAQVGSLLSLVESSTPYPLSMEASVGPTAAKIAGTVTNLRALDALDLDLEIKGDSMSELFPLIRVTLPPTPKYRLRGKLHHEGMSWRVRDFKGVVGGSDLDADINFETKPRRSLTGAFKFKLLDLADLGGFIGAQKTEGAGVSDYSKDERAPGKLLPAKRVAIDRLKAMDADVTLVGDEIKGRKNPITKLNTRIVLKDGRLAFDPLRFGIAQGAVVLQVHVAPDKNQAVNAKLHGEVRRVHLAELFPDSELMRNSRAIIGGKLDLAGSGSSFAEILSRLDGSVGVALSSGRLSRLLLEAANLNALPIIEALLLGDSDVAIRCGVLAFEAVQGVLETEVVLLDTDVSLIEAVGSVNFADEALDLRLDSHPKKPSVLRAPTPILVRGTLAEPRVRPAVTPLLARAGIATALGVLATPIAALIPLIQLGSDEDAQCADLIAYTKKGELRVSSDAVPSAAKKPKVAKR